MLKRNVASRHNAIVRAQFPLQRFGNIAGFFNRDTFEKKCKGLMILFYMLSIIINKGIHYLFWGEYTLSKIRFAGIACILSALTACATTSDAGNYLLYGESNSARNGGDNLSSQIQILRARGLALDAVYPDYPKVGTSYLSWDPSHGFQVTFYETPERSWLWYGGNNIALPAQWKKEPRAQSELGKPLTGVLDHRVCWKYGTDTYNPSTKKGGGEFDCTLAINTLQMTVGAIDGDVFNLKSGQVPYIRKKCDAPDEFEIRTDITLWAKFPVKDCEPSKDA